MPHGDGTPTGDEHATAARRALTQAKVDTERDLRAPNAPVLTDAERADRTGQAQTLALIGIGHALLALRLEVEALPERAVLHVEVAR